MGRYFRAEVPAHTAIEIATYYRERRMAAVVFGVDRIGAAAANAAQRGDRPGRGRAP